MKASLFRKLSSQLVASHLLVSLVSSTVVLAFVIPSIFALARVELIRDLESIAMSTGKSLEGSLEAYVAGELNLAELETLILEGTGHSAGLRYNLSLVDGAPLVNGPPGEAFPTSVNNDSFDVKSLLSNPSGYVGDILTDERGAETAIGAIRIPLHGEPLGVLILFKPLDINQSQSRRALSYLLPAVIFISAGSGFVGLWLGGRLGRPIRRLSDVARRLAIGSLEVQVKPSGPEELQNLALAFNRMAERMQARVDELRAFVANASHELRTPLTSVKLRAEALRTGALSDQKVAMRFLGEIENEVDRLSLIVSDLLDMSRIDAGMLPPKRVFMDLGVLANEVRDTFMVRAQKADIELSIHLPPELPGLMIDVDQIRRVITNLVDNALKFTPPEGEVEIVLSPGLQKDSIRLEVRDTGVGIPPKHLQHVFERFYRVDATRPRQAQPSGSGLGLAIAKMIVEIHGGQIGVSSKPGQGAIFWFELPVEKEANHL